MSILLNNIIIANHGNDHAAAVRTRAPRVFAARSQALQTLPDSELIERYRFGRADITRIVGLLEPEIGPATHRSNALDAALQVTF